MPYVRQNSLGNQLVDPDDRLLVSDRYRLNDEGPIFINSEGELFSIIIAGECNNRVEQIREVDGQIEVEIDGHRYTSHRGDEVVLLNRLGTPAYLFYKMSMELKRIVSIATNREVLHWQFDQLQGTGKTYHLRKSTLIPGHISQSNSKC
jgi:hypothetical protein